MTEPAAFPTLQTTRLQLREIVAADAPALYAIHSDAHAMRWFGNDPITEPAQALALIEGFAAGRRQASPGTRWGVALRDAPDALVGSCGLFRWNRGWRCCSIGYELAVAAQGRGLMREAVSAILGWGFEQMALHRVEAQVHPDNAASLRLLQGLGFVREGLQREAGYWLGVHHDMLPLALLRREFNAGHA